MHGKTTSNLLYLGNILTSQKKKITSQYVLLQSGGGKEIIWINGGVGIVLPGSNKLLGH